MPLHYYCHDFAPFLLFCCATCLCGAMRASALLVHASALLLYAVAFFWLRVLLDTLVFGVDSPLAAAFTPCLCMPLQDLINVRRFCNPATLYALALLLWAFAFACICPCTAFACPCVLMHGFCVLEHGFCMPLCAVYARACSASPCVASAVLCTAFAAIILYLY